MEPEPWQQGVLSTPGNQLLLCHRQAGKSTVIAAKALEVALSKENALVLLVSRSMRQSTELYRKVKYFYNALRPGRLLRDAATGLEIEDNGSRVLSLPASEQTIVGFSAVDLLVLDESARIPDGTFYSVRPMLARSQGSMIALSSPFGRRGWFYEAWSGQVADEKALDLATVERLLADLDFPVEEYSDTGLGASPVDSRSYTWTKTYLPATRNPRLSKTYLANERRSIPDLWFRQEWLCEFVELGQVVFNYDDLIAMASEREPFFAEDGSFRETAEPTGKHAGFALGDNVWMP